MISYSLNFCKFLFRIFIDVKKIANMWHKVCFKLCDTSVGANYREANRARSRADFKNKIKICEGEASETQYWIEIIMDVGWLPRERLKSDHEECSELLAIFTSISINTPKKDKKRKL